MGTILLVDDDAEFRTAMQDLLEGEGFHVATAADGWEALQKLEGDFRPDLMVLDLLMPECDGRALLAIREVDPALAQIPVIVMSGDRERNDVESRGVIGVLPKQLDPVKLVKLLKAAVHASARAAG